MAEGHQLEIGAQRAPRFLVNNNICVMVMIIIFVMVIIIFVMVIIIFVITINIIYVFNCEIILYYILEI